MKEVNADIVINYYDGPIQFAGRYKTEAMDYAIDAMGWLYGDDWMDERKFVVYGASYDEETGKRKIEEIGVFDEKDINWTTANR